jgi:hypothetical protein
MGSRCFSTLPRCRCRTRPWITPPGSSAATARNQLVLAQAESGSAGVLAYLRKGDTFATERD